MFVMSGKLKVCLISGEYILGEGDSIYFDGGELTEISNASDKKRARWISMITPPVF
jgi:quercetin dioxygenase-like cupin family protein